MDNNNTYAKRKGIEETSFLYIATFEIKLCICI